ncbi:hypothetical protein BO71DRAFT_486382 [Aspergillus ellipticus CBS 707.79]|uniref:Zn(2)-C6 fungal-type domain-containing protein n=1 Tax=Aspergillus ellipticus CBS 707.79 TaxID=1448320 RepID=A0A319DAE9_9EURO|nr:hypothetical protein BO71DRAFT_486382 [Aspergillus ellipticus CBS 707.79]
MSSPSSTPGSAHPTPKRRRVRKGTFSCWECKHRKRRCKFEPASSPICVYCRSHGSPCISQEHADPRGSDETIQERVIHVEALVGHLIQQRNNRQPSRVSQAFDPNGGSLAFRSKPGCLPRNVHPQPSPTSSHPTTTPGHPIHRARRFIQLALGLQQLQFTPSDDPALQLKESTTETARRYLGLASCHVTSQDILVDSMDGLDTLLLEEARYHVNSGNLRAAWLLFRRALNISEMIGVSQRSGTPSTHAKSIWSQLVFNDRFLSLMLGLPFAVNDHGISSGQALDAYPPVRRLDRVHCVLAGRIIARNLRMRHREPVLEHTANRYDDYGVTRDIDAELKKVALPVPVECWEIPTLDAALSDTEKMDMISRLITQMHHANASALPADYYAYSKQAVPAASREVLTRCLAFRNIRPVLSYRGLQPKAYTAAVALLLSHIERHRVGPASVLEHQRPQDLVLIQKVLQTLNKLIAIEAENITSEQQALKLPMPYFGPICIMREPEDTPMVGPAWSVSLNPSAAVYNHPEILNGETLPDTLPNTLPSPTTLPAPNLQNHNYTT